MEKFVNKTYKVTEEEIYLIMKNWEKSFEENPDVHMPLDEFQKLPLGERASLLKEEFIDQLNSIRDGKA